MYNHGPEHYDLLLDALLEKMQRGEWVDPHELDQTIALLATKTAEREFDQKMRETLTKEDTV